MWWGMLAVTHAGILSASVFELSNGDRITGELIERNEEVLVIDSPVFGRVTIPVEALVAPVGPPENPEVVASERASGESDDSDSEEDGEVIAEVVDSPRQVASPLEQAIASVSPTGSATTGSVETAAERLRDLEQLPQMAYDAWLGFWEDNILFRTLGRIYPLMGWNNQVNIGFYFRSSQQDEQRFNFRFVTERQIDRHQLRFEGQYEFARTSRQVSTTDADGNQVVHTVGQTTQDRLRSNARYRFDYVKDFFIQSDTRYTRDVPSAVHHQLDELVGIGYRWLNEARLQGSVTPSVGTGFRQIGDLEDGWTLLGSLQQDFEFILTDRLKVTQETSLTYSPGVTGDYIFVLQAGLENQLTQRLSMNLRYDMTYDDRLPDDKEKRTDGVSLTFGAKF